MTSRRWDRCIHHRAAAADQFVNTYFASESRTPYLIGGAGFDPRSNYLAKQCAAVCGDRLRGFFLREERPNPDESLRSLANANDLEIRDAIESVSIQEVQVFGIDNAPVGGRRAVQMLSEAIDFDHTTDILLDCSALSVGVMFPLAQFCLEAARHRGSDVNLHLFVLDAPHIDSAIQSTSCGKAAPLHAFDGGLELDESTDAVRLWLPQLGGGRRQVLELIYQHVQPHAVSPIVPFPAANPRQGDLLVEEYEDLFDAIGGQMTMTWDVDARDIVYAHEKNPLDLYRSVLNIADARDRVFMETGGSKLVLSPLGSKAVAIGLLMAALERSFSVVSVESIEYRVSQAAETNSLDGAELVHVWLHGSAYS